MSQYLDGLFVWQDRSTSPSRPCNVSNLAILAPDTSTRAGGSRLGPSVCPVWGTLCTASLTTAFLSCLHMTCWMLCLNLCYYWRVREEVTLPLSFGSRICPYWSPFVELHLKPPEGTCWRHSSHKPPGVTTYRLRCLSAMDLQCLFILAVIHAVNFTSNKAEKNRIIDTEMEGRWRQFILSCTA
jgi:hypothetical protein